jgi:hypothetical protein
LDGGGQKETARTVISCRKAEIELRLPDDQSFPLRRQKS